MKNTENQKTETVRVVTICGSRFKVIDLTEPLREDVEVYPGDPQLRKKVLCSFENDGPCRYNIYTVGDHLFHPHGDAPKHHNPQLGHLGFESWGIDYAFNTAIMLDLASEPEAVEHDGITFLREVGAKHLQPRLESISGKGAVVIRTGYDRWLESNKKHDKTHIPFLNRDAVKLLAEIDSLRVIAVDSLTVDEPGENYGHRTFADKLIVESMVNLSAIPRSHRDNFTLQTSPVAIAGATGGPVLAYAYIPVKGES